MLQVLTFVPPSSPHHHQRDLIVPGPLEDFQTGLWVLLTIITSVLSAAGLCICLEGGGGLFCALLCIVSGLAPFVDNASNRTGPGTLEAVFRLHPLLVQAPSCLPLRLVPTEVVFSRQGALVQPH